MDSMSNRGPPNIFVTAPNLKSGILNVAEAALRTFSTISWIFATLSISFWYFFSAVETRCIAFFFLDVLFFAVFFSSRRTFSASRDLTSISWTALLSAITALSHLALNTCSCSASFFSRMASRLRPISAASFAISTASLTITRNR